MLFIQPLSYKERLGDALMKPLMYLISGTLKETPQRTHKWNTQSLSQKQREKISSENLLIIPGNPQASQRYLWFIPLFHVPLFGGWKEYVVIEPQTPNSSWYIGWTTNDLAEVSRVPLDQGVRMLLGKEKTYFFGINSETGKLLPLKKIATGFIGDGGPYKKLPLL